MIVAILLAAAAAQTLPAPPASDDIVVIGERWKRLRIVTKRDRRTGTTRCIIKPPSGDPALDAGVCDAYLACAPTVDTASAMEACMRPPILSLVAERKARPVR